MKLTTKQLRQIIKEEIDSAINLNETHSDDFDMGAHVRRKRMDRDHDPRTRNLSSDTGESEEHIDLSHEEKISKAHAAAEKAIQVMKRAFPDMSDDFFEAEREKLISAMMNIV